MYQPSLPKVHMHTILRLYFVLQPLPGHCLCSNSDHRQVFTPITAPNNVTTSSTKMYRYGIPQPIWQQIGSKTLTATTKVGVILLTNSQQWFWSQSFWNTNYKNGFQSFFLMFGTFQYRGLHHLDMYCTLITEAWLKSIIHFDCRYL